MGMGGARAGVREEREGRAALHLRLAAGGLLRAHQSARLPLPWYVVVVVDHIRTSTLLCCALLKLYASSYVRPTRFRCMG